MFRKKIFLFITIIFFLFACQFKTVRAFDFSDFDIMDAVSGFFDGFMSQTGIESDTIKNMGQMVNNMDNKTPAPAVSITFTPLNPKEGEKLTATAIPTYFLNDPKDLYYTWFLKTKDCTDRELDRSNYVYTAKCDLDNDGEVDIEDYKIKAARIIANDSFNWQRPGLYNVPDTDEDGYEAYFGGNDQKGKTPHCYVRDVKSGDAYPIPCDKHLFPEAPHKDTGDDDFDEAEEEFWHTDPNGKDTAHTGKNDEANVCGLGINTFTWEYQKGDQIGIAVEGVSTTAAQTNDSSYRTMWAMTESTFQLSTQITSYPRTSRTTVTSLDTPILGQTTTVTETTVKDIDSRNVQTATISTVITTTTTVTDSVLGTVISSTSSSADPTYEVITLTENDIEVRNIAGSSELNQFLYKAFVTPSENGPSSQKLDVSLSYSPSSPINDSSVDGIGDNMIINSSVNNAQDNQYLKYTWEVFQNDSVDPDSWVQIARDDLPSASQMSGVGLDNFKFKLNLPEYFTDNNGATKPLKFLKVKLNVRENVGNGNYREGNESINIPISSSSGEVKVYDTIVSQDPQNPQFSLGDEICSGTDPDHLMERIVCPVTKNRVIGISLPGTTFSDFNWKIDGKTITYPTCFFDGCDSERQTNTAVFPILKEVGEKYTIELIATNQNGEKINLSRVFRVVDPKIEIVPASSNNDANSKRIVVGNYVDLDGIRWPDYSKQDLISSTDLPIQIKADLTGFSLPYTNYSWNVDGKKFSAQNASDFGFSIDSNGVLTLPAKETPGEAYSTSVKILYSQDNQVKKALNKYWGVSYDDFYEKVIFDDANITVQSPSCAIASTSDEKIFASIFSATPSYLAFLLRIVLTTFLIIFVSKLIFLFSFEDRK